MLELVPISLYDTSSIDFSQSEIVCLVCETTRQMYDQTGYDPPWIGYLAIDNGRAMGTCAFKSAPENGRVEIAYFTFPDCEGRGVATAMVGLLLQIVVQSQTDVVVFAQTLRIENASMKVLTKHGFQKVRSLEHPEDGPIWEWELCLKPAYRLSEQMADH